MSDIKSEICPTKHRIKHIKLKERWTIISERVQPPSVDSTLFEHKVIVPGSVSFLQVIKWCEENLGPIDQDWTYERANLVMFKDRDHAVQLSLVVDTLQ